MTPQFCAKGYSRVLCCSNTPSPIEKKMLRLHNIESNYYSGLAQSETRFFKKILFQREAKKYDDYQAVLAKFDRVFTLSHFEQAYVQEQFGNGEYVPVFHGNSRFSKLTDFGDFAFLSR